MKIRHLFFFLFIFLAGCQARQAVIAGMNLLDWRYADLRALDPVDAAEPSQDLIALYARINGPIFQMRIDFLDLDRTRGQDIYILIDTHPGGTDRVRLVDEETTHMDINWDYLLVIPPFGNVKVLDGRYAIVNGIQLLISRDTVQDNIVLSLNVYSIPIFRATTKIQVFITEPSKAKLLDKIVPVSIDAPSPTRAKVSFVFWNTFNGRTPAETLRSWAGAHSGPMSTRHGLQYLLNAATQTNTPVVLLDLLKPETLSALDYIDALPRIQDLVARGILVLPGDMNNYGLFSDNIFSQIMPENSLINNDESNKIIKKNNLRLVYLVSNYIINGVGEHDYAQYAKYNRCLSINQELPVSAELSTFVLQCKIELLIHAVSNPTTPLTIGGNFSDSLLGEPSTGLTLFTYIQNHPWIQVLTREDFTTENRNIIAGFPSESRDVSTDSYNKSSSMSFGSTLSQPYSQIFNALLLLPDNEITQLAWEVFGSLYRSSNTQTLSSNYAGQIGPILAAAKWADQPINQVNCSSDLDFDNKNECILSNSNIFLTLDLEGGYIPFIFSHDEQGYHQIVGPTWEFMLGISDPSLWDLTQGVRSDPDQVLGAFDSGKDSHNIFTYNSVDNKISIASDIMAMRKSVTINSDSVLIEVQSPADSTNNTYVPLVIDPWTRFSAGWVKKYINQSTPESIVWGIQGGVTAGVKSSNPISFYPINSTREFMTRAENPNFDYPRGHYLPFPLALAEIKSTGDYTVTISINSADK